MINKRKTNRGLTLAGWGIVGEPQDGVLVPTGNGIGIDVSGYNEGDYWSGEGFLGPDPFGIVPVYRDRQDRIYPRNAKQYPYKA